MSNQCMGCQAGWPLDMPLGWHQVQGGYPGERVSCTADRYVSEDGVVAIQLARMPEEKRGTPERNWGVLVDGELHLDLDGNGMRWTSAEAARVAGRRLRLRGGPR